MASIRNCPKSPTMLELRFRCCVTGKLRSVAVGSGDMQAAERLKGKIEEVLREVKNGERQKPPERLIKEKRINEWYRLSGRVELGREDLRAEWLADLEGGVALSTLATYTKHINEFDLDEPKKTLQLVQKTLSVSTAKKYRTSFGTYWQWLIDNEHTTGRNPIGPKNSADLYLQAISTLLILRFSQLQPLQCPRFIGPTHTRSIVTSHQRR
jgi:hypothetical protein